MRTGYFAPQIARAARARGAQLQTLAKTRFSSSYRDIDQPLRVLFCGSDEFSITSLEALHQYAKSADSNVASIDVATKTDKRTGRGLKVIKPPPIKPVAEKLGLPVHQFDTFRGWSMPDSATSGETYINMIIAVSFGLLVPPRILRACQYGGLNVHPSMLPDLKGSSPIEHSIINGYRTTGVTVQTLHPSKFDEGKIVLQTPSPGIQIPDPDNITSQELRDFLAPVSAEMLVRSLRERLYLSPQATPSSMSTVELNHAPKLLPEARHISFQIMTSTHILRLNRALGRLWMRPGNPGNGQDDIRLILGADMRLADEKDLRYIPQGGTFGEVEIGFPFSVTNMKSGMDSAASTLLVRCADGKFICIPTMRLSGSGQGNSAAMAAKANLLEAAQPVGGDLAVRRFRHCPG